MKTIISEHEIEVYESFPFAISIAEVVGKKIIFKIVSKGFCDLFGLNRDEALTLLNDNFNIKYLYQSDLLILSELKEKIINNKINDFNILIRLYFSEEAKKDLINITAKKFSNGLIYFSYNNASKSYINNKALDQYMQKQQTIIAEDSLKAIVVISKKDLSILYSNKVANRLFNINENKSNLKCYELLCNITNKCSYCPLNNQNNINKNFEIKNDNINKTFSLHIAQTFWNNEEAYIEYFNDITKEKNNEHLFKLYKSLIGFKKNSEAEVGALFCFDIETSKVVFYFLNSTDFDFDNKTYNDVVNTYYPYIFGDNDKKKYKEFLDFNKIIKNYSLDKTDTMDFHQIINNEIKMLRINYNFFYDSTEDKRLLIVNVYDYTQRIELERMINAIVSYQNEIVTRQDMITKEMIVYARKDNFLKFPIGYSRYSFKKFENHVNKNLKILDIYGDKKLLTLMDGAEFVKNKSYSTTYVLDINGEIRHKRSLGFRDNEDSLFIIVYDVTDLALDEKEKNQKLIKVNKDLKKAEQKAIEVNKGKSEFLSRMSHDMRTPLGAIIGLSSFGMEECENLYFSEFFKQINENGQYLLSLVNDILDFQKMDNNFIELNEKVSKFGDTEKSILRIVKLKAKEKKIVLNFKIERELETLYIFHDEKRMKQILINILNNSIKYTHPGGFINWSLVLTEDKKGNPISIYKIEDNGVGMSKNFQKQMFEPFTKEYNKLSEAEGGTGLGLVITKKLVDSMNGTIECISEINKGTKFIITIPRKIPSKIQIENYKRELKLSNNFSSLEGLKILICEDVVINQLLIRKILEEKKIKVTVVDDGIKGVDIVRENEFDAILMDIRMPKMNGLEASIEIRKFNKTIPIIALSANAFSDDIKKSLKAGMNEHLAKPINKDKLYFVLSKLLNK